MKNHPLYKKLKQIALDRNYTVEQAQALDFNQAAELLETHSFSLTFLVNMKYGVIDALRHRDDENDLQQLKETAKNWLDIDFPDWEAERGRQGDKPYITFWLRGKP
jgi:hypothetical protein